MYPGAFKKMSIREKFSRLPPLPPEVAERLEQVVDILKRHPVRLAYLFGSAAEDTGRCTDIDIAVLPDEGFSYRDLYADLSLALNTDRLDLVDLRVAPTYLLGEILGRGKCLLALSEVERARFEAGQLSRWREDRHRWHKVLEKGWEDMSLQKDFLVRALEQLERVSQELEKYRDTTPETLEGDLSLRWTVERGLLAGLNLIFRIADHILSRVFRRSPDTYEGLLLELKSVGVISEELYRKLKGAGGFRNVLVHEYVEVDLGEVASVLREAPGTFRAFRKEVLAWLKTLPKENGL